MPVRIENKEDSRKIPISKLPNSSWCQFENGDLGCIQKISGKVNETLIILFTESDEPRVEKFKTNLKVIPVKVQVTLSILREES